MFTSFHNQETINLPAEDQAVFHAFLLATSSDLLSRCMPAASASAYPAEHFPPFLSGRRPHRGMPESMPIYKLFFLEIQWELWHSGRIIGNAY
jgi:hypothetical protein